jgi:hypothetical protein
LELLGQANNPVEFINSGVLFVNGELRVADDVEEENVRDLKLDLLFNFGGHNLFRRGRGNELLKARIISDRIPPRIESQQRPRAKTSHNRQFRFSRGEAI